MTGVRRGSRVRLSEDVNLLPHTVLRKGETGVVLKTEEDAAGVYSAEVRMDRHHSGLNMWENVAHLVDPELAAVVPIVSTVRSSFAHAASVVFGALSVFGI